MRESVALEKGNRGIVFNLTRYMLEDGPGIRTVVFLKGCPLRCLWCSNPLGQTTEASLVYFRYKCISCRACIPACPNEALFLDEKGKIGRDLQKCTNCGQCSDSKVCPVGARQMHGTPMTVQEVIEKVEKDRIFYRRGGGGVTLSGGEILMQAPFGANILRQVWDRLIHTAIETCAFGRWEDLKSILTYTNLAFIDMKHFEDSVHRKLTGRSNNRILENIKKAAAFCLEAQRHLIIRLAVVPGFNDSNENLQNMAQFLKVIPGDWELNLIPYHKYGVSKYEWLGQEYQLTDVLPPSRDRLKELAGFFESFGILCSVGGGEIKSVLTTD